MKIFLVQKNFLAIIALILINLLTFAGHSTAMSKMSPQMSGMNHDSSTNMCTTLCRTTIIDKEKYPTNDNESDDNTKPATILYIPHQTLLLDKKSIAQRLYAERIKPPPKTPAYILNGVFRT